MKYFRYQKAHHLKESQCYILYDCEDFESTSSSQIGILNFINLNAYVSKYDSK